MDPFPIRGDHLANWDKKGKNKKVNESQVQLGTDSQVQLNTDSQDQLKTDSVTKDHFVQWKKGMVTNQLKILESRAMHNVNKNLITHHGSLLGRLRPKKMLQAEIFSSSLSWNYDGSRLMAGGNHMLRIWSYPEGNLLHDFSTGLDSYGIHSARFIMELPHRVVSGTQKVQLWDINNNMELASFNCHRHRVPGVLAVEGSPDVIWSGGRDATVRRHDFREVSRCESSRCVQLHLNGAYMELGEKANGDYQISSFDINPARPYSILIGGQDCFARLCDIRNNQFVQYYCPKHLSTLEGRYKEINHVAFSSDGSEALINYTGDNLYLIDMKQERLNGANEPEEYGLKVSDSGSKSEENCDDVLYEAYDISQKFVGHLNVGDHKKEANFIGKGGEYIACGSDDGMLYIFEKRSAKLISRCLGHKYGIICVQSHPTELAIATSGLGILDKNDKMAMVASGIDAVDPNNEYVEKLVKIWTPDSVDDMALTESDLQCMEKNQMYAREGLRQNHLPDLIRNQIHNRRLFWL